MLKTMYTDAFIKLDPEECETVLSELDSELNNGSYDPQKVTILGQELSFYPGFQFLDIADFEFTPHYHKFVVYKPGDFVVLNWTNQSIYELNDRIPISLNKHTAVDYVRFFFNQVRGPHGKFVVVESVDDIPWKDEPPAAARKAIGQLLRPVSFVSTTDDNGFLLKGFMTFKDSLYSADIKLSQTGRVKIENEDILADELPLIDDILEQ